jgi:hypothetical protein
MSGRGSREAALISGQTSGYQRREHIAACKYAERWRLPGLDQQRRQNAASEAIHTSTVGGKVEMTVTFSTRIKSTGAPPRLWGQRLGRVRDAVVAWGKPSDDASPDRHGAPSLATSVGSGGRRR